MKHYLVLPKVFLCFVAVGVLSGCTTLDIVGEIAAVVTEIDTGPNYEVISREIDMRGAWGVKISEDTGDPILPTKGRYRIRRGKTTKSAVLAMLSIPEEKTSDDRFFLYRYEMQTYKVRDKDGVLLSERIPVGRLGGALFLIWFDQADIVKRYRWHECEPTADRKCHSANQLCEMIKGLKDEQLIAQYC